MMYIHPFRFMDWIQAMGLRDTSLHTAGFIYGITGTTTALSGISYGYLLYDWPLNIGGKPHFSLPAWIPITFELTVLVFCRGYGTYFLLSLPDGAICKKASFQPAVQLMI